ncbi:MAG: hypothetical protein WA863_06215, partial [Methyloceanibacter sp.]
FQAGELELRASELADSLQLTFNGAVAISIPSLTLPLVDFVAQGTPIPAIEGTSAAINLEPYKMAVITSLSGEILRQQRSDRASSVGCSTTLARHSMRRCFPTRPP